MVWSTVPTPKVYSGIYWMAVVVEFPNRSVTRTITAAGLFVTETLPLTSVAFVLVDSVPPPASSSATVTFWVRTGTGWFELKIMSIRRQPFGALHFAFTVIVVVRVALATR